MLKLIFVHVPKCGGASVVRALTAALGSEAVYADRGDSPLNPASEFSLDPEGVAERFATQAGQLLAGKMVACGHVHAAKYAGAAPDAQLVTLLRDPIERVISHYYFWKQPRQWDPNPVRGYAERHALGLLDFARLPAMIGFYRHRLFAGLERSNFAAVGRTENMRGFTDAVSGLLGLELKTFSEKVGSARLGNAAVAEIEAEREAERPALARLLADEIDFYRRWTGG